MRATGTDMQVYVDPSRTKGISPTPLFVVFFIVTSLFLIMLVLLLEEKAQYSGCTLSKSKCIAAGVHSTQAHLT